MIGIRKNQYKYICVNKNAPILFDMENDPGENVNLAGNLEYKDIEKELYSYLMSFWNGMEMEQKIIKSQRDRVIIRNAHGLSKGLNWEHQPFFDANKMYVR